MDLSKLPRLSNTDAPPPPPAAAEPGAASPRRSAPVQDYAPAESLATNAMDAWLSIAIGVILIFISPRIWQFLISKCFHTEFTWTFTDPAGAPLPFTKTVFFWGDLAFATFAACMILEGIVVAVARKPITVSIALGLTILSTLLNLGYVSYMLQQGYGFQILSGLATAFGVYLAMYEWQLLQSLRA